LCRSYLNPLYHLFSICHFFLILCEQTYSLLELPNLILFKSMSFPKNLERRRQLAEDMSLEAYLTKMESCPDACLSPSPPVDIHYRLDNLSLLECLANWIKIIVWFTHLKSIKKLIILLNVFARMLRSIPIKVGYRYFATFFMITQDLVIFNEKKHSLFSLFQKFCAEMKTSLEFPSCFEMR